MGSCVSSQKSLDRSIELSNVSSSRLRAGVVSTLATALVWSSSAGSHKTSHGSPSRNLSDEAGTGPISRLPDSLLYSVLLVATDQEPVYDIHGYMLSTMDEPKYPTYNECLGWMRLSAVCRRWRAVILHAAILWAEVAFFLPSDVASLALARAGTAPLSMYIPTRKDYSSALLRKIATSKRWEPSCTHRERLLDLAITHSHRMSVFIAQDLSSDEYRSIFRAGRFDFLTVLMLNCVRAEESSPDVHSQEELGHLDVIAPRVRIAYLNPTLPMAYGSGPGLHLCLPALRDLHLDTKHGPNNNNLSPPRYLTTIDQLRWLPSLIRDAHDLELLHIGLTTTLSIDWTRLFGVDPVRLPKLHDVRFSGTIGAHMDKLFELFDIGIPRSLSLHVQVPDIPELAQDMAEDLRGYGRIVAQSLCSPLSLLDCVSINSFHKLIEKASFALDISVFSSADLLDSGLTPAQFLKRHGEGRSGVRLQVQVIERSGELEVLLRDAFQALSHTFEKGNIRTLIFNDAVLTLPWANAMRRVICSSLNDVTTVHYLNSSSPKKVSDARSWTAAFRLLCGFDEHDASPEQPPTREVLPALDIVIVSMDVARDRNGDVLLSTKHVRAWWDELIQVLTCRYDAGMRLRALKIVGGWTSEKLRKRTEKIDERMLARVAALVDEVIDGRMVSP